MKQPNTSQRFVNAKYVFVMLIECIVSLSTVIVRVMTIFKK